MEKLYSVGAKEFLFGVPRLRGFRIFFHVSRFQDAGRNTMIIEIREASWTAPALPPSRRDGGWRFASR